MTASKNFGKGKEDYTREIFLSKRPELFHPEKWPATLKNLTE